jgi:hypothetical protein
LLIELRFLRGTASDNSYGPDPLAATTQGQQVRGIVP